MNHLLRSHAPITDTAWSRLDAEGRDRLVPALGARKLVDFSGPLGWGHSAMNLGRVSEVKAPGENLQARQRRVLPLVELRAPFAISRHELLDADRGATDLDLAELDTTARRIAVAENIAVFHGWPEAGIVGIADASSHGPITLGAALRYGYPGHVAKAVELVLVNCDMSGVYRSTDGGKNWTEVGTGRGRVLGFHFDQTSPAGKRTCFAATGEGLFRSDDDGVTWRDLTCGLDRPHPLLCRRLTQGERRLRFVLFCRDPRS